MTFECIDPVPNASTDKVSMVLPYGTLDRILEKGFVYDMHLFTGNDICIMRRDAGPPIFKALANK